MDKRQRSWAKTGITVLLFLTVTSGCGLLRSEFYRGETAHLLQKGDRRYGGGEYTEAKACYEDAVRLDPCCSRGHAALGNIAYVQAEFQEAATCYERAMALDPDLEKPLTPLYLDALRLHEHQELEAYGADFGRVMQLISDGGEREVETILSKDISVAGLARQAAYLSLKDQDRLLQLAEERALTGGVPNMCALFYGHLLALGDRCAFPAARLLKSAAREVEGPERQEAYMTLGAIYVRLGRENDAAGAYEQALLAGCPREEVLPFLAALYGIPVSVFGEIEETMIDSAGVEDRSIAAQNHGRISGPGNGDAMAVIGSAVSDKGHVVDVLSAEEFRNTTSLPQE